MISFGWYQPKLTRRHKFVILSIALTVIMVASLLFAWPVWSGAVMVGLAWLGLAYSFDWDLKREEWLLIPLPLLMAVAAGFGWLRLYADTGWLVSIGCVAFGVGVYGLLLTLNIVNLSTIKTMPLARTATSVLSMTNLMVSFVWYYLVLYYNPAYGAWLGGVGLITFAMAWPVVWLGLTGKRVWWRGLAWAGLASLLVVELAAIVGLWPRSFMTSLVLAGSLYVVLGVIHYQERRQVNKSMNQQYLIVFGLMLVVLYMVTSWYGGI